MLKSINTLALGLIMVLGACSTTDDDNTGTGTGTGTGTPAVPSDIEGSWTYTGTTGEETYTGNTTGSVATGPEVWLGTDSDTLPSHATAFGSVKLTPKYVWKLAGTLAGTGGVKQQSIVTVTASEVPTSPADTWIGKGGAATADGLSAASIEVKNGTLFKDTQTTATAVTAAITPALANAAAAALITGSSDDNKAAKAKIVSEGWILITMAPAPATSNLFEREYATIQKIGASGSAGSVAIDKAAPEVTVTPTILDGIVRRVNATTLHYIPLGDVPALTVATMIVKTPQATTGTIIELKNN